MSIPPATPPNVPLPDRVDVDVLVLPREVASSGGALYDDSAVTFAKELRSLGATAGYQHKPAARQWIGERSAVAIVLTFVIGVASNAGWAALKSLFASRYANDRVKGKIARCTRAPNSVTWEWFEVDGKGEEVARILEALNPPADPTE